MATQIFIVDEQGATFWFRNRADAESALVAEAWRGAVHLTIAEAFAPAHMSDEDLGAWAVENAPDCGCDL